MNNKSINIIKFKIYQSGWGKVHEYQTQFSFLYKLRIFEFWCKNVSNYVLSAQKSACEANVLLDIFMFKIYSS